MVLLIICFITLIKNIFDIIKEIKGFTKKGIMLKQEEEINIVILSKEEKRKKIINKIRESIKGIDLKKQIAILENEIPKLQEEETKEIYEKKLSELYEAKRRNEEKLRIKKEQEEERLRIEKEKKEEKIRIPNEVKDNVENNRFIETNMPLIAGEGCFEIFDNIEYYEYKTRYGTTNYEKINEGKLYITNRKLYFITEINAFNLIWLEHIIDIELVEACKLKIVREGNAIFLESCDEMDIYKMYCYIKTINGK